ncbi:hypothetical protein ABPG72_014830 [Tetrahymena utriculariae]
MSISQSSVPPKCNCQKEFIICKLNKNGNRQKILCIQICNAILDCGHQCQAQCHECAFGVLHSPCKEKIAIEYICGHQFRLECNQDPEFCEKQCQISECSHQKKKEKISQKQCKNKCFEECSFQISESNCKLCENSNSTKLYCGHKQKNLIEKFTNQFVFNPVKIPQCSICQEPINKLRFKNELQKIQANKFQLLEAIKSKINDAIQERKLTTEQRTDLSQKYEVFENQNDLFDQLRQCYLHQSVKYIQLIKNYQANIENFDILTQKTLNTISLQIEILERTYLQQPQNKLGVQHIRKFVNSVIYLTGLFYYYSSPQNRKISNLLDKFKTYEIPYEDEYNLIIYNALKHDSSIQLHLIEKNMWTSPIFAPIQINYSSKGKTIQEQEAGMGFSNHNEQQKSKNRNKFTPQPFTDSYLQQYQGCLQVQDESNDQTSYYQHYPCQFKSSQTQNNDSDQKNEDKKQKSRNQENKNSQDKEMKKTPQKMDQIHSPLIKKEQSKQQNLFQNQQGIHPQQTNNIRQRRQKKTDRMNFHEFQSLIRKDEQELSDFFFAFQDIKQSLPEIKQIDGYCVFLDLCKKMMFYDQSSLGCQMREYLKSILQSNQFKDSIVQILAQFYTMQINFKKQILENYASIFIYIIEYLDPNQYENQIRIYLNSMLKSFKMEPINKNFLQIEQNELEKWVQDQENKKQQIERQKLIQRFRPQQLYIIRLDEIDTNINNILVIPDREEFVRNIIIKDIQFDRAGVFFTINTQPLFIRNKKNYKWDDSRRLMNGSLLILTNDKFDKFYYLIVKRKAKNIDQEFKETNTVTLTAELEMDNIEGDEIANILDNLQRFFSQTNVTIFETKYYWEAYSHFLRGMKKMIQEQTILPFERTIIDCQKQVDNPGFVNYNTTYTMKIDINFPNQGKNLILIRDNWNTVNKGTFDNSQFNCLANILTKQVSIIQGPPGTGKTFVGSMAVKVLVDNYHVWNKQGRPILMICKTNHALDQFLKHILKFEDKIVRIGGRCQEESLQKYLLRNIKDQYKQSNKKFNTPSLRYLREQIEIVEELYKKIKQEVEDYTIQDDIQNIYKEDFSFNLKELIMDSFQKFGNFNLDNKKREYHILSDLILNQWWQCNIDSSTLEKFSTITENQFNQIQNKSKEWNKKMKSQKNEYLQKIVNEKKIDVQLLEQQKLLEELRLRNPYAQLQDLQQSKLIQSQQDVDQNEESDDEEENYFENKSEFEVEGNMNMKFLEKQTQGSYLLKVKCDEKELNKLIQQVKYDKLNLFKIDYSQAYNLKAYAIQLLQEATLQQIKKSLELYYQYQKQFKEEFNQDDARIIVESKCKIIGMTLNGASINSHLIKYLRSPIAIIEEAGEVLESLLIPVLQPSTQQLILIGDHQQLKPSVNNYDLEKNYNFNTSLLERLVKNEVEYAQLKVQRRMNPDFADYIRLIYNQYEDHSDLIKYKKNVVGMPSNMYLISHNQSEESIENSTSKKNVYEANYAIKLAQYIIMQKQFKEEEITILSMYLGQSQLIRKLARQEKISRIKISSVDNYQGEENEIIILSLVRSNQGKKLGYTKTENRINVSFSRAKRGFYVIGNFNMISEVQDAKLWQKIIDLAKKKQHLVESIYFQCSKHKQVNKVTHYKDFDSMPKGGCQNKCNTSKVCGHKCSQTCHPDECENYKCNNPCLRKIDECSHACQQKCYEKCWCTSNVYKTLLCGHQKLCACTSDIRNEKCQIKVNIQLVECRHEKEWRAATASWTCKKTAGFEYTTLMKKILKCSHDKEIPCNKRPEDAQCEYEVLKELKCGHKKLLKCFQDPNQENNCSALVQKQLKCNHKFLMQ